MGADNWAARPPRNTIFQIIKALGLLFKKIWIHHSRILCLIRLDSLKPRMDVWSSFRMHPKKLHSPPSTSEFDVFMPSSMMMGCSRFSGSIGGVYLPARRWDRDRGRDRDRDRDLCWSPSLGSPFSSWTFGNDAAAESCGGVIIGGRNGGMNLVFTSLCWNLCVSSGAGCSVFNPAWCMPPPGS